MPLGNVISKLCSKSFLENPYKNAKVQVSVIMLAKQDNQEENTKYSLILLRDRKPHFRSPRRQELQK